jgi:hypothetical protein
MLSRSVFLAFVIFKGREREARPEPLVMAKTPGLAEAPVGLVENRKVFVKLANGGKRGWDFSCHTNMSM